MRFGCARYEKAGSESASWPDQRQKGKKCTLQLTNCFLFWHNKGPERNTAKHLELKTCVRQKRETSMHKPCARIPKWHFQGGGSLLT